MGIDSGNAIKTLGRWCSKLVIKTMVSLSMFVAASTLAADASLYPEDFVLDGYDLVSYYTKPQPERGVSKHAVKHEGRYYAFSSAENAALFRVDPQRYLPAYDANCALGVVYGLKSSIDPLVWEIVDDRLHFFINAGAKRKWLKRATKNMKKGNKAWSRMTDV